MINDYSRIDDELYSFYDKIKLTFHTSMVMHRTFNGTKQVNSNYNEYKTSNAPIGSVVIKRKLNYYISVDLSNDGHKAGVCIFPEKMFEVIDRLNYIKNCWFNKITNGNIYGFVNNRLTVISNENIVIRFPQDKVMKIEPCVTNDEIGVNLYVDCNEPVFMPESKFLGFIYILSTIDMPNYANTAFSMATLLQAEYNRVDFTESNNKQIQQPFDDSNLSSGVTGRTFNMKHKSFFDP